MPRDTYTRTGDEVASEVKRIFGDEALVELKNTDLIRWINAAQREIAMSHEVIRGSASSDVTAEQTLYALPGNSPVRLIQGIHFEGRPLAPVSFQAAQETILKDDPDREAKGDPKIWYEWDGDIYIYPASDRDITGGLTLYYIGEPGNIVALEDALQVPDRFYNQIIDYVLGQAYRLDENWQAMSMQDQRFRESMDRHLAKETIVDVNYYPTKTVLPEDY
jgi:hypothetical protein